MSGIDRILLLRECGKGQGRSTLTNGVARENYTDPLEETDHFRNLLERPAGTLKLEKLGSSWLRIHAV